MIVVTTSWAPETALRNAGDEAPDGAGQHARPTSASGIAMSGRRSRELRRRRRPAERAHQELALGADVEQAGLEAEADGEAAEDAAASPATSVLTIALNEPTEPLMSARVGRRAAGPGRACPS